MSSLKEISESGDPSAFQYAFSGIGRDEYCQVQLVADLACTTPADLKSWNEESIFNTIKIRLRSYKTVSNAMTMARAARAIGWTVVVSADEGCAETLDTFLVDFAVGVGAHQLMPGSIECGEGVSKINRLLEIARENETIPFVGRFFRQASSP